MTTRDISNDNIAALNAQVVRPILFGRFDFLSGVLRFHTEIGPRTATHPIYGSEVYLGVGSFGGITSDVKETISTAAQPLNISLTGLDPAIISDALTDDYHRRDAELMFGFDDQDSELIDDPVILWSGYMDHALIGLGKHSAEMTLVCESRATNLQGSSGLRVTDEDLQASYSGDLAAEYVYRMVDLVLKWGGQSLQNGGGGGRGFAANTNSN